MPHILSRMSFYQKLHHKNNMFYLHNPNCSVMFGGIHSNIEKFFMVFMMSSVSSGSKTTDDDK